MSNFYISLVLFILYLHFVYSESYAFCNFDLDRGPQVSLNKVYYYYDDVRPTLGPYLALTRLNSP